MCTTDSSSVNPFSLQLVFSHYLEHALIPRRPTPWVLFVWRITELTAPNFPPSSFLPQLLRGSVGQWEWWTGRAAVNSGITLHCVSPHLCMCIGTAASCTTVVRHQNNKVIVLTAQGGGGFYSQLTQSEGRAIGYSIKVTLHIFSFLLNLLFIQHLVSWETDEGPFTLSRALHTTGLTHTHTHTHTHLWRWWRVMHGR